MREKYPDQEISEKNRSNSAVISTNESTISSGHAQPDLREAKFLQEQKDMAEIDRIMGFVRSPEQDEEKPVFCNGEVFDPWSELHHIKIGTKEEQKNKLAIFKEKLTYQKRGIAEIQKFLYSEVENCETLSAGKLKADITELKNKYALSEKQCNIFDAAINICVQRHEGILKNTQDCLKKDGSVDGEKLFEKIFKRKPHGKIKAITKAITVYFVISDIRDYAYTATLAYLENRDETEEEIEYVKNTGGRKLANSGIPGMEHVVTLENASRLLIPGFKKSSERILAHEEQHNFNDLIYDAKDVVREKMFLKEAQEELEEIEISNQEVLKDDSEKTDVEREKAERDFNIRFRVKDEICAYVADGTSAMGIRDMLLEEHGLYDYGEYYKKENKKAGERFSQEYIALVESGIVAMFDLIENGFSRQEASSLLFIENLTEWRLVVDRQLGIKKSTKKELEDMRNLNPISQRINRYIYRVMEKIFNALR